MDDRFWSPISIDCIDPAFFPDVALYLKSSGNYVLYKDRERKFTEDDRRRLENNFKEFLYVRSGDLAEINSYLENNLTAMLAREDLDGRAKGRILYQTSVNYVIDVFMSPETAANMERCRNLIQHLMKYVAGEKGALEALQSIAAHNTYIFAHSVQMTALNLLVHEKLFEITPDEMVDVGVGSLLHDFGMTFISDEILDKHNTLSDIEYQRVKQHAQKGYEFLQKTRMFGDVALTIVRHHHERYDGRGYPAGLKGDAIPRSAQLSAICDVYSALTTDRPYRKATSHVDAFAIMREEAQNGAFNSELVAKFEEIISIRKGVSAQERELLLSPPPEDFCELA